MIRYEPELFPRQIPKDLSRILKPVKLNLSKIRQSTDIYKIIDEANIYTRQAKIALSIPERPPVTQIKLLFILFNGLNTSMNISEYPLGDTYYKVNIKELSNHHRVHYTRLANECKLMSKITIELEKGKKGMSRPLFGKGVFWDSSEGYVIFGITSDMLPYFLELGPGYGQWLYNEGMALTNDNDDDASWLFMHLSFYVKRDNNEFAPTIEELKKLLGKSGKYIGKPGEFIKTQIDPIVKKINAMTSMHVIYKVEKKRGNWRIYFYPKIKDSIKIKTLEEFSQDEVKYYNILIRLGVNSKLAQRVISEKFVELKRLYNKHVADFHKTYQGGIRNPGAFLIYKLGYVKKAG